MARPFPNHLHLPPPAASGGGRSIQQLEMGLHKKIVMFSHGPKPPTATTRRQKPSSPGTRGRRGTTTSPTCVNHPGRAAQHAVGSHHALLLLLLLLDEGVGAGGPQGVLQRGVLGGHGHVQGHTPHGGASARLVGSDATEICGGPKRDPLARQQG